MSSDNRRAPRASFACEVTCTGVGVGLSPLNPRISDLSASGAFIDSMTHIPVGTRVKLSFELGGRPIQAEAEVAHAMPQFGMGVRFVEITDEDRAAIAEFVGQR